jgi:hypothetical protein
MHQIYIELGDEQRTCDAEMHPSRACLSDTCSIWTDLKTEAASKPLSRKIIYLEL